MIHIKEHPRYLSVNDIIMFAVCCSDGDGGGSGSCLIEDPPSSRIKMLKAASIGYAIGNIIFTVISIDIAAVCIHHADCDPASWINQALFAPFTRHLLLLATILTGSPSW